MVIETLSHFSQQYEEIIIYGRTEKKQLENVVSILKSKNIKTYHLPWLVREISIFNDILAFVSVLCMLLYERPKILHTHTSKTGFIGRLAGAISGLHSIIHTPHGHVFYGYGFGRQQVPLLYLYFWKEPWLNSLKRS